MKKKTMQVIFYVGAVFSSVCFLCWLATAEEQRKPEPGWHDTRNDGDIRKLLPLAYANLKKVDVYGKVVDQWTNGISDADVCISGFSADWMLGKRLSNYNTWTKTDKDGLFHAILKYPDTARPSSASKDGYELLGPYYTDLVQHRTTPENPVVLQMRKRGEAGFLIRKSSARNDIMLWTDGTNRMTKVWDILTSLIEVKSPPVEYADIIVDGVYDANAKKGTVTISATNGTDGVILGDRLLHEAPLDGYVKQCVLQISNPYEQTKYVYLRSRQPPVYSRIELAYNLCGSPTAPVSLRVYYNFCLNPYGERSFEYDERIEAGFNVRQTLTKEAGASIRSGKYPPKPADIGRQVREANEWFERDNEEKKRRSREFYEEQRKLKESKAK